MAKRKGIKADKLNKSSEVVKTKKAAKIFSKKLLVDKLENLTQGINSLRKRRYFPFLIILLVFICGIYLGRSLLFAAIIGGKPIYRDKLISELEKQAGKQALDSLNTKELVSQEAKRKGINITDQDVNSEIERITKIVEAQGTTLEAALATQGQTIENLTENIKLQKTVEQLLSDKISVSEEDIQKYFETNKSYYGEDAKFDDIKDSIKDQLVQEKLSSEFQILLEKLKSEGNIIYFVNFK